VIGASSSPSLWRRCSDVDATKEAAELVAYMHDLSVVPAISASKRAAVDLLELRAGNSALDVGAGTGGDLLLLAEAVGPDGHVVGVDSSQSMIDAARSRVVGACAEVDLEIGHAEALPFADHSFHAARADRTLQHLARPDIGLSELGRDVRPGGRVVVTEAEMALEAPTLDAVLTARVLERLFGPDDRRRWLGYMLPLLVKQSGLKGIELVRHHATFSDSSVSRLWRFEWAVTQMIQDGEIAPADGEAWLSHLTSAVSRGEVTAHMALNHLVGTVPARQ
jgi:SAM-dependent methyltransferase